MNLIGSPLNINHLLEYTGIFYILTLKNHSDYTNRVVF